jgi:hypothetical protein
MKPKAASMRLAQKLFLLYLQFLAWALSRMLYYGGWKKQIIYLHWKILRTFNSTKETPFQNLPFARSSFSFFRKRLLFNLSFDALFVLHNGKSLPLHMNNDTRQTLKKLQKGGLLLCAHLGNFEELGKYLKQNNIPVKASYLPLKTPWANRGLARLRQKRGNYTHNINGNPRQILTLLKEKKLFALLADQNNRNIRKTESNTPLAFLGQVTHFSPLLNFIEKHHSAPVYLATLIRQNKEYRLELQELENTQNLARHYAKYLEDTILKYPEHWYGITHRSFLSTMPELYHKSSAKPTTKFKY